VIDIVKRSILEDLKPSGDITSKLIKNNKLIKAKIISNENCVVGGLGLTKKVFKLSDKKIIFQLKTKDGRKIKKGKVIAIIYGKPKAILKSERVALNFLSLVSGVATITKKYVDKINNNSCKILCTRKTIPNLRSIQRYGVKLGGGYNHRFNLSDEVLIKDNHIAIDGDIRQLVKRAIKNKKGKKITVEVDNLNQFKKIIGLKFDRILFDNMNLKNLKKGVKLSNKLYETEASGGVTLKNVKKISSTGINRISIGIITHSAPAINFKLEI
jgi:nicotinate-nucleotide pyrophosphorylase (carboxylating)